MTLPLQCPAGNYTSPGVTFTPVVQSPIPPNDDDPYKDIAPGTWVQRGGKVTAVFPNPQPPGGSSGIYAYSGAALDGSSICVSGGGHQDSGDNSIYCHDTRTLTWTRAWGPSALATIPPKGTPCSVNSRKYADGNPSARHTYHGIHRIGPGKLLLIGGSMWCAAGDGAIDAWELDLPTGKWTERPAPPFYLPLGTKGGVLADGTVYLNASTSNNQLYKRLTTGVWQNVGGPPAPTSNASAIDPKRGLMVYLTSVGVGSGVGISTQRLDTGALTVRTLTGDALPSVSFAQLGALDYDDSTDRMIVWTGTGTPYAVNLDTNVVTQLPGLGTPPGPPSTAGTFGRFRCLPGRGVCVLLRSVGEDPFVYRVASGGVIPVPPDPTPTPIPPVVITLPPGVFVRLEKPSFGGPTSGSKHVTAVVRPTDNLIFLVGGDYQDTSTVTADSYRQEIYTLNLEQRLNGGRDTGWTRIQSYCQASTVGGVQPKSPDYHGYVWDSLRQGFWWMPGTSVLPVQAVCQDRTVSEQDDPHYLFRHIMFHTPTEVDPAKRWTDWGKDQPTDPSSPTTSWQSVHDPVRDLIVRPVHHGGNGGGVQIYNPVTKMWRAKWLESGAIPDLRISQSLPCTDLSTRSVYWGDPQHNRMYRYDLDAETLTRSPDIPGASMSGTDVYIYAAWRPAARECWIWNKADTTLRVYSAATNTWRQAAWTQDTPGGPPPNVTHAITWHPGLDVLVFLGTNTPGAGSGIWVYKP